MKKSSIDHAQRWVLVMGAVSFIVLAGFGLGLSRKAPTAPGLIFLGYTNKPHFFALARVLVTNGSSVPLQILPQTRSENVVETNGDFFHVAGFHTLGPENLPRVVPPGRATVVEVHMLDFREPWWTEVATRPQVHPSRLRDFAARIRQPTLRWSAQRLFPPVETTWTKLGPFTNLPPGWVRGHDGEAWPRSREFSP